MIALASGERDLTRLLATMAPERRPGEYVYVEATPGLEPHATIVEPEGTCHVVDRRHADAMRLDYDFVAAWITLTVHSALDAVGLTAAVSTLLADAGISCNVIAGLRHDHLLVPVGRADEALALLAGVGERGV